MRVAWLFSVVTLVSGCVSVQNIPLAPADADALRGRQVAIASREQPDFMAMTAGRAAIGGLVGALIMTEGGKNVVTNNNIQDPAGLIARTIGEAMKERYQLRFAGDPIRLGSDDVAEIAKAHPSADVLLEVRTINWGYSYYPTSWNRYRVLYSARLRLIDAKKGRVLAEGFCTRVPDNAQNAPNGDELLANGAQIIKNELTAAADVCLQHFRTQTFALGPGPSLVAAAAPAAAPASVAAAPPAPATAAERVEFGFWDSIKASRDPADFNAYLAQYPNGRFAAQARERLAALTQKPAAAAPASVSASALPQPGDAWSYRLTELKRRGQQRRYDVKVTEASDAKIVDQYTTDGQRSGEWKHSPGVYLVGFAGSVFSPYLAAFRGDLSKVASLGTVETPHPNCAARTLCEASATVVGRESVRVPAGDFEAIKIKVTHTWRGGGGANSQGMREIDVWYAPAVKRAVKFSSRQKSGITAWGGDYDLELTGYQLK